MSSVSYPVTRPLGRALIVGGAAFRQEPLKLLRAQGFDCAESDDAYTATIEMCRNRLAYRSLVLCLASFYREELNFIATVKRRMPHVEIWLTQTDGRMGALVDAMNLGADGLLAEDGTLHRLAAQHGPAAPVAATEPAPHRPRSNTAGTELLPENEPPPEAPAVAPSSLSGGPTTNPNLESNFGSIETTPTIAEDGTIGEPVLTADELRALLQDQPTMPPAGGNAE